MAAASSARPDPMSAKPIWLVEPRTRTALVGLAAMPAGPATTLLTPSRASSSKIVVGG